MKHLVLAVSLAVISMQASAFNLGGHTINSGGDAHAKSSSKSLSGALAGSESKSGSSANNGGVEFNDRLQIPNAPGLSSGSSNTTSKHRKYKQRQVSFVLGGWTNIDMELDIISFLEFYFTQDAISRVHYNAAACIDSAEWRKYKKAVGDSCK